MNKKRLILIVPVLIAIAAAGWWLLHRNEIETDNAAIEAHTIPISAKVPGYITSLQIDDNQRVVAGESLVEIDPRDYQIARDEAAAALASAQASATNAAITLKRMESLNTIARSRSQLDDAIAANATAQAAVANATATLAQADKNLVDTHIIAPEDGTVTERGAEAGAYVQPGQVLFYLVPPKRWVVANFKETQLKRIRPGQKVDIAVDAYPNLKLHGLVDSIQHGTGARFSLFPVENATGNFVKIVQRVPVKITLEGDVPEGVVLGAGMSVVPTIHLN